MRTHILICFVALMGVAGCNQGEKLLADCEMAVGALPKEPKAENGSPDFGLWDEAKLKCGKAKGERAKVLQTQVDDSRARLLAAVEKWKTDEDARRAAEQAAARQAIIDACQGEQWVSVCELNGQPTGGAFYAATLNDCEKKVESFRSIGAKCVDCGCSDNLVKVMNGVLH